jgi:hypothetical protein
MGRTKGSKNKPKVTVDNIVQVSTEEAKTDIPVVETPTTIETTVTETKKRGRKGYVPEDPTWVLTESARGTPIAIIDICKTKGDCYFMVIPNYRERNSKTTIHSTSVIKPEFTTPEIEKEFEGIVFATEAIKQPVVLETILEDTLNDANVEIVEEPK